MIQFLITFLNYIMRKEPKTALNYTWSLNIGFKFTL